jgi:hypothetical protein
MSKLENLPVKTESDIKDTQTETGEPEKGKPRGRPFQKGNKCASLRKKQPNKKKAGLESYIQRKTSDGKKLADFYIGIIDSINNNDKAVACEKCDSLIYNGIRVNSDLVKEAHTWLTLNGWGRPSSRGKPLPDEPEMSREDLIAALRAMESES